MNEHGGNRRGEAETIDENMEDGATPEMKRKKAMYLNTTAEVKNGVESEGMITETAQVEERDRDKRRQRREDMEDDGETTETILEYFEAPGVAPYIGGRASSNHFIKMTKSVKLYALA